jgi:nitrite reductase/ring-hydroxylating ferredoxin subunit
MSDDALTSSRREFLQCAGGCFAGVLVAFGLPIADAAALPIGFIDGAQAGSERRYPIPVEDSVSIDREQQVILARFQGHVYAFALACPHQNASVKWLPLDHRFQCTKHDSVYRPDGVYTSGRATRNLDRFPIRRDGESVLVDITKVYHSDTDAAAWNGAGVTLGDPVPRL